MSASTPSQIATPSTTLAALQRLPSEFRAPIAQAIPYIGAAFSFLKLVFGFLLNIFSPILRLSPLPFLRYVFAPLIVFLDITVTILIRAPYRTASYLLEALFPLYVLVGVACITGVLLGLAARMLCRVLVASLQPEESQPPMVKTEPDLNLKRVDSVSKKKKKRAISIEEIKSES